jgi:hypothetical protein
MWERQPLPRYSYDDLQAARQIPPMTRGEVVLAWHRMGYELRWVKLSGFEFQSFFEEIMAKLETDFIPITPTGPAGDRKSDGHVPSKGQHFQVYAPPTGIDTARTIAKIREDFDGVLAEWPQIRSWIFVWSTPRGGLPPQVVSLLADLAHEHPELEIDQWGLESLWQRVRDLPEQDRIELLGPAPGPEEIVRIDSADVLSMLNTLAARPIPRPTGVDLSLTEIGKKMELNGLGDPVRVLITSAYGLFPDVQKYLDDHPDPSFPSRVAEALKALYNELTADLEETPDALFGALVLAVATPDGPTTSRYWSAVAIVGFSFELCDIFKK